MGQSPVGVKFSTSVLTFASLYLSQGRYTDLFCVCVCIFLQLNNLHLSSHFIVHVLPFSVPFYLDYLLHPSDLH